MAPSREDLSDLMEETFGVRNPDFEAIRRQYDRITENVHNEVIESDVRILLAGLDAAQNTCEDWNEMDEYEREQALSALEQVREMTRSTLRKYDITVD